MTTKQHATEGTQQHHDISNVKNNIKYLMTCHDMSREEAQSAVKKQGYKFLSNEEINRAIIQENKRQEGLKKREEAKKKEWENLQEKMRRDAEQLKKDAEEMARKAQESAGRRMADRRGAEFVGPTQTEEKKPTKQGRMKVSVNEIEFAALTLAMVSTGKYDTKETPERSKHWNNIRKHIQKGEEFTYQGDVYKMV